MYVYLCSLLYHQPQIIHTLGHRTYLYAHIRIRMMHYCCSLLCHIRLSLIHNRCLTQFGGSRESDKDNLHYNRVHAIRPGLSISPPRVIYITQITFCCCCGCCIRILYIILQEKCNNNNNYNTQIEKSTPKTATSKQT